MKWIVVGTYWFIYFQFPVEKAEFPADMVWEFTTKQECRAVAIKIINARDPAKRGPWSCSQQDRIKMVPATAEELEVKWR